VTLVALGVLCAAAGTTLVLRGTLFGGPAWGWTAYAPLSLYSGGSRYTALDPVRLAWARPLGAALLAAGAGTSGAAVAALVLRSRPPGA